MPRKNEINYPITDKDGIEIWADVDWTDWYDEEDDYLSFELEDC